MQARATKFEKIDVLMGVRVKESQRDLIHEAANYLGMPVTAFLRNAIIEKLDATLTKRREAEADALRKRQGAYRPSRGLAPVLDLAPAPAPAPAPRPVPVSRPVEPPPPPSDADLQRLAAYILGAKDKQTRDKRTDDTLRVIAETSASEAEAKSTIRQLEDCIRRLAKRAK